MGVHVLCVHVPMLSPGCMLNVWVGTTTNVWEYVMLLLGKAWKVLALILLVCQRK